MEKKSYKRTTLQLKHQNNPFKNSFIACVCGPTKVGSSFQALTSTLKCLGMLWTSLTMLLSFATCTYKAQFIKTRHNNLHKRFSFENTWVASQILHFASPLQKFWLTSKRASRSKMKHFIVTSYSPRKWDPYGIFAKSISKRHRRTWLLFIK